MTFAVSVRECHARLRYVGAWRVHTHDVADPWIPNPVHGSTFRSALDGGTGFWDDPSSWSANRVPTANDRIIIQAGDEVVIRNTNAVARHIGVYSGGKLSGSPRMSNTELQVVTLLVLGRAWRLERHRRPIASNVTATVTFSRCGHRFEHSILLNTETACSRWAHAKVAVHGATTCRRRSFGLLRGAAGGRHHARLAASRRQVGASVINSCSA